MKMRRCKKQVYVVRCIDTQISIHAKKKKKKVVYKSGEKKKRTIDRERKGEEKSIHPRAPLYLSLSFLLLLLANLSCKTSSRPKHMYIEEIFPSFFLSFFLCFSHFFYLFFFCVPCYELPRGHLCTEESIEEDILSLYHRC
ncbi:hypothetical protein CSUI_004749 [Cystoisospora suis]|uniref:Transmembrane protein n=1 Tax=Cystoisospora suis TaxID=483139 RepID=A0A2C6KZT8_9APIC|nr:hypothetical protein CSUI_004749 [Cystoisospora suis]